MTANIHHCTVRIFTPQKTYFLLDACHHGHVDIVKLLLERQSSISLVSGHGLRPIHTAANNGQGTTIDLTNHTAACVGLLLQYGEDVDVVHNSEWRYTPLHWACQEGKTDVVKLLLEHKANIHIKCGKTPQTALQISQKNNFTEIINLLQQQELKEIQNSNFKVFLEYAGKKVRDQTVYSYFIRKSCKQRTWIRSKK